MEPAIDAPPFTVWACVDAIPATISRIETMMTFLMDF
jgi:hypothetical protein